MKQLALVSFVATLGVAAVAQAHVGISSGPGFANTNQEVVFSVGHGCENADTSAITIDIPASVTSVRPLNADLGKAVVTKNAAGLVTQVTWQKSDADLLDGDLNYYKVVLRIKVPNQPFTTLPFVVHQTCKTKDGKVTTVDWASAEEPTPEGQEPAALLRIVPARLPGWNKVVVPVAVTALATYFADAQIVWRGDDAFSVNPETAAQIAATEGVKTLSELAANDEIWVKY